MLKRILPAMLSALLLFSIVFTSLTVSAAESSFKSAANLSSDFSEVCSNENFELHIHSSTYEIALFDKRTGKVWYSNPKDREEDKVATGKNKMNLNSAFEVVYRDVERDVTDNVGSYIGAIMYGAVKTENIKNGIRVYYRFNDIKSVIPLQYKLHKDGLSCTILAGKIKESEEFPILSINMLSYFGAGSIKDTGYLLVPDGSGALINFNNGKQKENTYNQKLYGRDETFDVSSLSTNTQTARLPVFGIKCNNDAFLAVITEGDALANVTANVSGKLSSYNRVGASFSLRMMDNYAMGQGAGSTGNNVTIYDEREIATDNLTVRYFPLETKNSDYSGMARKYREYLIDNDVLSEQKAVQSMHLEFMGAIRVQEYLLGVPYKKNVVLTDTDAISSLVGEIKSAADIPVAVKYTNWNKSELKGQVNNKAKILGSLGGKSGLKKLVNEFKDKDVSFYLDTDYYKTTDFPGFGNKKNSGVITLYDKPLTLYDFSFIDYFKDPYAIKKHLISFRKTEKYANKFYKSFGRMPDGLNISIGNIASSLYSDYSIEGWSRQSSLETISNVAKLFAGNNPTMVMGGNAYALNGASVIIDAPNSDSKYDIVDETVPFYAIAMSGVADYSYSPVNLSGNYQEAFLKAVEAGASIHFLWVNENEQYLKKEGYSTHYSVNAGNWIEKAKSYAEELAAIAKVTDGSAILSHTKLAKGVYKTVYDNGAVVLVNYNAKKVTVNGATIEAEDYIILKGSAAK